MRLPSATGLFCGKITKFSKMRGGGHVRAPADGLRKHRPCTTRAPSMHRDFEPFCAGWIRDVRLDNPACLRQRRIPLILPKRKQAARLVPAACSLVWNIDASCSGVCVCGAAANALPALEAPTLGAPTKLSSCTKEESLVGSLPVPTSASSHSWIFNTMVGCR